MALWSTMIRNTFDVITTDQDQTAFVEWRRNEANMLYSALMHHVHGMLHVTKSARRHNRPDRCALHETKMKNTSYWRLKKNAHNTVVKNNIQQLNSHPLNVKKFQCCRSFVENLRLQNFYLTWHYKHTDAVFCLLSKFYRNKTDCS